MIKFFENEKAERRKIWINELPEVSYDATEILKDSFCASFHRCESKSVAIELALPRDSSSYALLGASYTPDNSSYLNVQVKIGDSGGGEYKKNIASALDRVFCGIPKEYGDAILKQVYKDTSISKISAGVIEFNIGAYGIIGSSTFIFSLLTQEILNLIFNLEYKKMC